MASTILGKQLPAPDLDSAAHCEYSTPGAFYAIDDGVIFADEQDQPGLTVAQEVDSLGLATSGSSAADTEPASGLSPDAVTVTSTDSGIGADGSSIPLYTVAVVWQAGDVQKIVVTTTKDPDGTQSRLLDAARSIYAQEK